MRGERGPGETVETFFREIHLKILEKKILNLTRFNIWYTRKELALSQFNRKFFIRLTFHYTSVLIDTVFL